MSDAAREILEAALKAARSFLETCGGIGDEMPVRYPYQVPDGPQPEFPLGMLRALAASAETALAGPPGLPSHGIALSIWYEGESLPQYSYLPPGVGFSTEVPRGGSIRRIETGPWKPPPPREMEEGWCIRCRTPCGREKGTVTWYNFYGRDECKAADQDGIPHEVVTGDQAQARREAWHG